MTKIIKKFIIFIVSGSIMFSQSCYAGPDEQLPEGGCRSKIGSLSVIEKATIEDIASTIEKEEDAKLLSSLYLYLIEDAHRKNNARPEIQKILESVANRYTIITSTEHLDEGEKKEREIQLSLMGVGGIPAWIKYLNNFVNASTSDMEKLHLLIDFYTNSDANYPEFSYEAALCREIQFLVATAMIQKSNKQHLSKGIGNDGSIKGFDLNQFAASINSAREKAAEREKIIWEGLSDLWDRPLDDCAQVRLWSFANRLTGGTAYFDKEGIEKVDRLVIKLKQAAGELSSPITVKAAQITINKLK